VREAGSRLGYVHLDDNDGQADLHWPLFQGVLSRSVFHSMLDAFASVGYKGPVSIELRKDLPNPIEALMAARDAVNDWGRSTQEIPTTDPLPGQSASPDQVP
jgi:sugar phosphate isomerase/epimerase